MKIADTDLVVEAEANAVHCFDEDQVFVVDPKDAPWGCPNDHGDAWQEAVVSITPLLGDPRRDRDFWHHGRKRYEYLLEA